MSVTAKKPYNSEYILRITLSMFEKKIFKHHTFLIDTLSMNVLLKPESISQWFFLSLMLKCILYSPKPCLHKAAL